MRGSIHMAVGGSTAVVVFAKFSEQIADFFASDNHILNAALIMSGVVLGSLMPDIDTPKSTIGKMIPILPNLCKHRGIWHSLIFPLLIAIGTYFLPPIAQIFMSSLLAGWILHIFADMFNKKGVPILMPFHKKHIHVATIQLGSISEKVFLLSWISVVVILCFFPSLIFESFLPPAA